MIVSLLKSGTKAVLPRGPRQKLKNWLKAFLWDTVGTDIRLALADQFIRGTGIEIGALNRPLPVGKQAQVRFVDRLTVADARRQYPELNGLPLVEPDILTDGETLAGFADRSQDFVIANHFVEHTQDPIGTLQNIARVLKPGGVLFMGLPDKRYTFDVHRPETPFEHLLHDHTAGPEGSRLGHYEEWVRLVEGLTAPEQVRVRTNELADMGYSIHFHVWTPVGAHQFVERTFKRIAIPYELLTMTLNPESSEMIFILRIGTAA
jgi:SAM-dependent methyltransferase